MPLPYRLAAIDLDDTLLGPDKLISLENAQAVQDLRDNGVHVVLASGRRHENMLRFHQRLGLSGPIVSCNGALVRDAEIDAVYYENLVPADLAADIIEQGDLIEVTQNYYHTNGGLFVREKTMWTELYQTRTGSVVTEHGDLADFAGDSPLKILWIADHERIAALLPSALDRYGDRLYITTTDPEYLEFMARGVSKAVGVGVVAERMGVSASEVVAFGDSNNDVPMLEWAGMSVAVGHARPAALAAAKIVAPEGDPETALARAVDVILRQAPEI